MPADCERDRRFAKACKEGLRDEVAEGLKALQDPNLQIDEPEGHRPLRRPLFLAISSRHEDVTRLLLEGRADPDATDEAGMAALHYAVPQVEMVRLLVHFGARIDTTCYLGMTPLHRACAGGWPEAVSFLLEAGADKNLSKPLLMAARNGHSEVVRLLIKAGADKEVAFLDKKTSLHHASAAGHATVVELLAEDGAHLEAVDAEGMRPLHLAASLGNLQVLKSLLKAGALMDVVDPSGATALHHAAANGYAFIANCLLQAKANCEARNGQQLTPLHVACERSRDRVVASLVAFKADLEAVAQGQRPLHFASLGPTKGRILRHRQELVRLLLAARADLEALARGKTAEELAREANDLVIAEILSQKAVGSGSQPLSEPPESVEARKSAWQSALPLRFSLGMLASACLASTLLRRP